jgi:endoglucanase Acf2
VIQEITSHRRLGLERPVLKGGSSGALGGIMNLVRSLGLVCVATLGAQVACSVDSGQLDRAGGSDPAGDCGAACVDGGLPRGPIDPDKNPDGTDETPGTSGGATCSTAVDAKEIMPAAGCWGVSNTFAAKGPNGTKHPAASLKGPVPTNRWWSSLLWNLRGDTPYSAAMYPHPLSVRAIAAGLSLSYVASPALSGDGRTYVYQLPSTPAGPLGDLEVGVDGMRAASSDVVGFSDWTVNARWADGAKELVATIGKGMPFVYFRAHGGAARIGVRDAATVWHDGDEALGITVGGKRYAIFAPKGATWAKDARGFTSTLAGKDYLSVAALPDDKPDTFTTFRDHAYAFVTGTKVSWCYDEPGARLTASFALETQAMEAGASDVPLVALYPHQWTATSSTLGPLQYVSPRGTMKVLATKAFDTTRAFHGVLPALPWMGKDDARLKGYVNEVAIDPAGMVTDTYNGGKQMAKMANLAAIAEQEGLTAKRDASLGAAKTALESWFSAAGDTAPLYRYHADWGTLIGYPASFGSDTELNDHHFHWAYSIKTAAMIALYDPTWAKDSQYGGMVKMLIRDASNPLRGDAELPFMRNFDVYEGHAWASGHANFADGNNQESSSESMHYATSLVLFGEATGNRAIRDLGIFLYTTESAAIRDYWFDADKAFPAGYTHPAVGIVWGSGGAYATWWTAEPESIHGINFLPFHGGSLYLGEDPAALRANYEHMVKQNGGPEGTGGGPNDWQDILWLAQSLYDPNAALAKFEAAANTYKIEGGETRAHTYHWLASMAQLGQVDASITADVTTYAVFKSGATRTYVAFNSGCDARTVRFSDGTSVQAAARTLVASRGGQVVTTTTLGTCAARPAGACAR